MNFNDFLKIESEKDYFIELQKILELERAKYTVFPSDEFVYKAIELTELKNVKIVLLGQDPYHGINQAHGLSFSVQKGVKIPPSLKNIYKEMESSINFKAPNHGFLEDWAKRGMLLLNSSLTVRSGEAASHSKIGWETFTDNLIKFVSDNRTNVCFVLLGNFAISKRYLIDETKHFVITGVHPSPLSASRGFLGSGIFKEVQNYCIKKQNKEFDFTLEE